MIYWKSHEDNNWKENHCLFPRLIKLRQKLSLSSQFLILVQKLHLLLFFTFPFSKILFSFTFFQQTFLLLLLNIVTSLRHGELEDDPEEDAEGDDAKDDPDDDEVAGAAAEAVVLLRRRRRRLVAVVPLPHRELAGGPSGLAFRTWTLVLGSLLMLMISPASNCVAGLTPKAKANN